MLAGGFNQRGTGPIGRLAPAVNAGIGLDLDQRPVVLDAFDQEGLYVGDLHQFGSKMIGRDFKPRNKALFHSRLSSAIRILRSRPNNER